MRLCVLAWKGDVFATYSGCAGARALGFALTFYPTVLLLIWQLVLLAVSVSG